MFIGVLQYEYIPGNSFVGRPLYMITSPLAYYNAKVSKDIFVRVEEGFVTDFASIPSFVFFLKPKDRNWREAAVIHDKACEMARANTITMKQADDYLYYAMLDNRSSKVAATLFWFAVRTFHILKRVWCNW